MIFRSGDLRKPVAIGLGILCVLATACAADPTAQEILEAARVNPLGNQIALDAQLRRGSKATLLPSWWMAQCGSSSRTPIRSSFSSSEKMPPNSRSVSAARPPRQTSPF